MAARDRFLAQSRALGALTPKTAPRELDDSLEWALSPGGRQDRVLAAVRSLPRIPVPSALEGRIAGEVDASDFVPEPWGQGQSSAESLTAPPALDHRVDQSLRALAAERAGQLTAQPTRKTRAWSLTGLAAAAALLVLTAGPWIGTHESTYSFTVVRGSSGSPLQAHQLSLLAAVTGRQCSPSPEGQR